MPTRLFLDFGTAYCKAATCKRGEPPVPLPIGEAVRQGRGDRHMIRTALFVSQSGSVYFGEAAVDAAASERRLPYDEIKDVLTRAESRSELYETLRTEDNPTGEHLTTRDATTLFLAFFTQAALQGHDRRQELRRSIAVPVFKKNKQSWVTEELAEGLANANVIAQHFGDNLFRSIDLADALRVLRTANRTGRPQVVADPPTVAEPIAAVAGHLLHFEPDGGTSPGLIMIVDIGAGTTDIAMFAKGHVDGIVTMRHVKESKGSLPWAGKAVDRALIDHMVGRSSRSRLRADLQREGMGEPIKEDIFRDHVVTRFGMSTSLDEFLQSEGMSRVQAEIRRGFEDVLLRVDRSFFGRTVAVRFSGGGHELPFLKDLVKAERYLGDRLVRMGTANKRPRWQDHSEFVELSREVGNKFHRLAVALGGAYYCAESRAWLRLDDEVASLGIRRGPTAGR